VTDYSYKKVLLKRRLKACLLGQFPGVSYLLVNLPLESLYLV